MANKANQNLSIWENVRTVDRTYTKPITGKGYKGDSINPTYMVMRATEVLGPIGQNWGINVLGEEVHEGAVLERVPVEEEVEMHPLPDPLPEGYQARARRKVTRYEVIREKWHQVHIELWQIVEGERRTFEHFGGTQMFYKTNAGKVIFDEDAAKKSFTDATNKALSQLGVGGDVFLGLFDDKYALKEPENGSAPTPSDPPAKEEKKPQQSGNRQSTADGAFDGPGNTETEGGF